MDKVVVHNLTLKVPNAIYKSPIAERVVEQNVTPRNSLSTEAKPRFIMTFLRVTICSVVSFIGGGNRNIRRNAPTNCKLLEKRYHIKEMF
jgi:hypothetical protein